LRSVKACRFALKRSDDAADVPKLPQPRDSSPGWDAALALTKNTDHADWLYAGGVTKLKKGDSAESGHREREGNQGRHRRRRSEVWDKVDVRTGT
jgi:hypothetical protein